MGHSKDECTKLKKNLPKKKKPFKATRDESSTSEDEEQTNKGEVVNYALMALNDEISDSNESYLPYDELLKAFHDLFDECKLVGKKYKLL